MKRAAIVLIVLAACVAGCSGTTWSVNTNVFCAVDKTPPPACACTQPAPPAPEQLK